MFLFFLSLPVPSFHSSLNQPSLRGRLLDQKNRPTVKRKRPIKIDLLELGKRRKEKEKERESQSNQVKMLLLNHLPGYWAISGGEMQVHLHALCQANWITLFNCCGFSSSLWPGLVSLINPYFLPFYCTSGQFLGHTGHMKARRREKRKGREFAQVTLGPVERDQSWVPKGHLHQRYKGKMRADVTHFRSSFHLVRVSADDPLDNSRDARPSTHVS